jgi:hypothetical protein
VPDIGEVVLGDGVVVVGVVVVGAGVVVVGVVAGGHPVAGVVVVVVGALGHAGAVTAGALFAVAAPVLLMLRSTN